MATTFDSRYPFQITVPDNAISYENGEAIVTFTAVNANAADLTLSNLSSATDAVTNLGGTVVGAAVFTAVDAPAAATAIGATAAGAAILTAATAAAQRTAMGVPATTAVDLKADTHPLPAMRVDLIDTETGGVVRMIPLFAGTLVTAGLVLDGATTAAGACSVAITIDGVPVVLAAPLSAAAASAAGTKVTTTVSSGGAFTANQVIEYTTTSANTAATFGTVSLGATRA